MFLPPWGFPPGQTRGGKGGTPDTPEPAQADLAGLVNRFAALSFRVSLRFCICFASLRFRFATLFASPHFASLRFLNRI